MGNAATAKKGDAVENGRNLFIVNWQGQQLSN